MAKKAKELEQEQSPVPSAKQEKFLKMLATYEKQNPAKYALKKDALLKQLAELA